MSPSQLTEREMEILRLLAEGYKTSEISKYLSLSYAEVADSSVKIKRKLKVETIAELIQAAACNRLLIQKED